MSSERGGVKWMVPSSTFPARIERGPRLDPASLAVDFFKKGSLEREPQAVAAEAWLPQVPSDAADADIIEHAQLIPESSGVLSMLWIPERAAAELGLSD